MMKLDRGLEALSFTLAGARYGTGPFLGFYLQHGGFDLVRTGFVTLAPLVAAIMLGVAGAERYADRVARNEAFNHARRAVDAGLLEALGSHSSDRGGG